MNFPEYLDRWLIGLESIHAPPPKYQAATKDEIGALCEKFQHEIDENLIAWWEVANGTPERFPFLGVFTDENTLCNFCSLDHISIFFRGEPIRLSYDDGYAIDEFHDARIQNGWSNSLWLPFASCNGDSTLVMVDYAPTELGTLGQIIAFQHDGDAIYWIADSFSDYLEKSLAVVIAEKEFAKEWIDLLRDR